MSSRSKRKRAYRDRQRAAALGTMVLLTVDIDTGEVLERREIPAFSNIRWRDTKRRRG